MDAPRFINALRIMWNLDRHHLVEAAVLDADDKHGWEVFRDNPHDAAIRLGDERAEKLWALVESKQPKTSGGMPADPVRDAAPDMLAALILAERHLAEVCGETSETDLPDWRADLEIIRLAISKAGPTDFVPTDAKHTKSTFFVMLAALRKIAEMGPQDEPEEEDYDDTESAYGNGCDVAAWEAAKIARAAISNVEGR